ncbi:MULTISPECIES: D-2-hydroxyacid dehydrogenase [Sphingobacterium]|uniref:D-2-hydroxyacid dehydrogenase n=1 Tax=Sphingobacterium TaxID=28453 RepID=UPI00104801DD|nr:MULTISPECIES: D-2-hydroxyacid dehydrogenase [Sphingobacterium]MCW2260269.1 D-3-phosphoglycerate dehydrogenase [Sphingobacterium kitahiroshimense]NJI71825.1 3-phosphoglycerate dehydrogenase [Sphingobacterium sp. B16(2022)]TCR10943.1 D-3-phosphoglycerate dehydrogenase [Sphingobacterium sp. JUb78]
MRILANDGIDPAGKQLLEDAGFEVDTNHIPQEELAEKLQAYDAITVRSATKVRQALIDVCPNLKVIGRGGVGMDNIDVDYARSKGIAVLNTPAASSLSVAELVFAHLLNGVRFLYDSNRQMPLSGESKFGALKKAYAGGTELRGKTLGVVGFGRIGRETAKIGLGLGMDIVYYDLADGPKTLTLSLTQGFEVELPVDQVSMEDLLKTSDFITLHVPFLDKPAIGQAEFALLKDQVGLVNAARGGVIDELALIEALDSGKVAFAGLDVFDNEPTPRLEILKHPKISLTPHIGAATNEAQERIGVELAQLIIENLNK